MGRELYGCPLVWTHLLFAGQNMAPMQAAGTLSGGSGFLTQEEGMRKHYEHAQGTMDIFGSMNK